MTPPPEAETLERYRSLIENSTEGIVEASTDGRILQVNRAMARMLGYPSSEEFLSEKRNMADVWADPADRDEFVARLAVDGLVHEYEACLLRHARDPISVSISAWAVRDSTGRLASIQGFCTDITGRKARRAALVKAKEAAEHANRAKDQFLSRVSHELRTPLNAIVGFSQLMLQNGLDAEQRSNAEEISKAASYLLALVDDVLDLGEPSDLDALLQRREKPST